MPSKTHAALRRWAPMVLLAACATGRSQGAGPETAPHVLLGAFTDDYGNAFRLSPDLFEQLPRHRFHVVEWHTAEQYFIARNDDGNREDAGGWTRIDWIALTGMPPYTWGFCMTAYRATTQAEARATPAPDRSAPRTGCNGYPFSRMKPEAPLGRGAG